MLTLSPDGGTAAFWSGGVSAQPGDWGHCTCVILRQLDLRQEGEERVLSHEGAVLGTAFRLAHLRDACLHRRGTHLSRCVGAVCPQRLQ